LLAEDGTFLLPLSARLREGDLKGNQKLAVDIRALSRVAGLASRSASPALLRAQLELVRSIVRDIHPVVGYRVESLTVSNTTDVQVRFENLPFPVMFSGDGNAPPIAEQGERCAILLRRFSERWGEIDSMDLAFDKVGVVRLKGGT
jgi:hypothetical protein